MYKNIEHDVKKVLLLLIILVFSIYGCGENTPKSANAGNGNTPENGGGTGSGGSGSDVTSCTCSKYPSFSDILMRSINTPKGYQYFIINGNGTTLREIAPYIDNKFYITFVSEKIAFITTKSDIYRSKDGWNNFIKIFSSEDVSKYKTGGVVLYYSMKGNLSVYINYTPINSTEGLKSSFYRYQESYDYGDSWKKIGEDYDYPPSLSRVYFQE